jgi:hypothetical protein
MKMLPGLMSIVCQRPVAGLGHQQLTCMHRIDTLDNQESFKYRLRHTLRQNWPMAILVVRKLARIIVHPLEN